MKAGNKLRRCVDSAAAALARGLEETQARMWS